MLAPVTELEAVNSILASIGESPVSTLEDNGVVDSAMALRNLRGVSREVQGRGWHFNTDVNYPLVPETSGRVPVPSNAVRVEPHNPWASVSFSVRDGFLYNRKEHNFKWPGTVYVDMILIFPFDEIPQYARNYISVRAARIFQQNTVGSQQLAAFKDIDEARALVQLKEAEAEVGDYNILRDNASVQGVLIR